MEDLSLMTLGACRETVIRQNELLPLLAKKIGAHVNEILYQWALRKIVQSGIFSFLDENWQYFFHGLECNLRNLTDGRFIRVDFGPSGTTDTFTSWGVLQFIMTSKSPWNTYEKLKCFFSKEDPPHNQFSGDLSKMSKLWDELVSEGMIEIADKNLIAFQDQFSIVLPTGLTVVRYPRDISEEKITDCSVAGRYKISRKGLSILYQTN